MPLRVVDENALFSEARKLVAAAERQWAMRQFREWIAGQPEIHAYLEALDDLEDDEPAAPELSLVGAKGAAEILGVHAPHVTRYRKAGRLVAIPVEGGNDVFDRRDVEQLATELRRRRK